MKRDEALKILGLGRFYTEEDVKKAFGRLAKRVHPDVGGTAEAFNDAVNAKNLLLKRQTQRMEWETMFTPKKRESGFQSDFIDAVKAHGAVVRNNWGGGMGVNGWPDLYVAHPFWTGWPELKRGTAFLEPLQQEICRKLVRVRVPALCVQFRERNGVYFISHERETLTIMSWEEWEVKGVGRAKNLFRYLREATGVLWERKGWELGGIDVT